MGGEFYIKKALDLSPITNRIIPVHKVSIFNSPITADDIILPTDIMASNPPCTFRIYCVFDTAGTLRIERTYGMVTVEEYLNSKAELVADCAYIFDVIVDEHESINLIYSVNATLIKLSIVELGVIA